MHKHNIYIKFVKRLIDVLISGIGIVVSFPVVLVVAALVLIKLGSPVFFKQERSGLHGTPFYMYKFRSMTNEIDENGVLLPDEIRLTKFGSMLRKFSLDELPQFYNIFLGRMSIIGPRPLPVIYQEYYNDFQMRRLNVKPGIVGLASIRGRNKQSWDSKFKNDIEYVDNCSFRLDCEIFLKAIITTLKHDSVDAEGYISGEPFIKQ